MGILDSIKNLANKAMNTVKDVAEDAQTKTTELKADFDQAGGAKGLLDKAGDQLSELGQNISEATEKAVNTVKETANDVAETAQTKAAELKADYDAAGGAKGLLDKATDGVKDLANTAVDAVKGTDNEPPTPKA